MYNETTDCACVNVWIYLCPLGHERARLLESKGFLLYGLNRMWVRFLRGVKEIESVSIICMFVHEEHQCIERIIVE